MPHFNHKGPESLGPKTGMKLGTCRKTKSDTYSYPENRPFRKGRRKKCNNKITKLNVSKMKRIAIPITSDNTIEDHFGHSRFYEIYTFSSANEIIDLKLLESEEGCGCKSNIINDLVDVGVKVMLSGNIGDGAVNKLNDAGISVIRGCSGKSSDVILQYVEGDISDSGISCLDHNANHENEHVCSH
tara:strand:- start:5055 stop:5612 length:558 start_codon:yes stop_codon:yes gene_type:complete